VLADSGVRAVIVCPIGFLSDNIEVLWDLDNEVRSQAQAAGIAYARAATPNADRRLARLAHGLIDELRGGGAPQRVAGPAGLRCGFGVNGAPCGSSHCAVAVTPRGC
jgi:ferrochelatase